MYVYLCTCARANPDSQRRTYVTRTSRTFSNIDILALWYILPLPFSPVGYLYSGKYRNVAFVQARGAASWSKKVAADGAFSWQLVFAFS